MQITSTKAASAVIIVAVVIVIIIIIIITIIIICLLLIRLGQESSRQLSSKCILDSFGLQNYCKKVYCLSFLVFQKRFSVVSYISINGEKKIIYLVSYILAFNFFYPGTTLDTS